MKKVVTLILSVMFFLTISFSSCMTISAGQMTAETVSADASNETADVDAGNSLGSKAFSAAIVVGITAAAGAVAMGMSISKSAESTARQPEAAGKINSMLMLGLVFIETLVIYALIVAILIIFVL